MKSAANSRLDEVKKLQALLVSKDLLLAEKETAISTLQEKKHYLLEQFRLAQQKKFGKSSEAHPNQGELFNEAEQLVDEVLAPDKDVIHHYTRQKPKRKPLPKDLPREVWFIADDEKVCDGCGHDLHLMGEKKSEQLEFIPAQIKVIETVRPQYGCRVCEKQPRPFTLKSRQCH